MFFAAIGDGVFPAFTGLLMKAISPDMLFYSMALLNAALLYLLLKTVESLKEYEEPEGR